MIGPHLSASSPSCWTLRIYYKKDGQSGGYFHQLYGSNVQVFNTTVLCLKDIDQTNGELYQIGCILQLMIAFIDYIKTIGQMIVSIVNAFADKSIKLNEKTLNRYASVNLMLR